MKIAKSWIDKTLEWVTITLVLAICIIVIWQVITRFIFNNPSSWSEEISRYLLIWIAFLGGSLGLKHGTHMGLVLVTERIKNKRVRTVFHILAYLVCASIGYIFIHFGYIYTISGMKREMMCVSIPMGYVYIIMPISGVIIILNSIEIIVKDIISIIHNKAVDAVGVEEQK